ncbi:hypothetical protein [Sphaerochaeta globosa]|uniref:Uncharacterized protein n=1 Tax=Sphaerochaeta globosa (strain ATCC BAA-1886 / DSM 22777 / Buddy) TaxID=158189 RepID=F0RRD6_SPHGB|nr:hypothetical protein [Sphaerochaeta globosa]ADY14188.1 hypothetical protein SpiBuddy_2373 [Sphaerochaeta globosa str. Buddy]
MYLRTIKKLIEPNNIEYTNAFFMDCHIACEAYFSRLMFIGLRMNGVSYKQAMEATKESFLHIHDTLEKALVLINKEKGPMVFKEENLKTGLQLFVDCSAGYRNKLQHGAIEEINDLNVLKLIIDINLSLIREIEFYLMKYFNQSAFDSPGKWGAKRIITIQEIDDIRKKFKLKPGSKIMSFEKSNELFSKINWQHKK